MWDLLGPEIEPMSPALAGRFWTTGLQGKSQKPLFYFPLFCLSCFLLSCSGSFTRVPSKLTLLGYLPVFNCFYLSLHQYLLVLKMLKKSVLMGQETLVQFSHLPYIDCVALGQVTSPRQDSVFPISKMKGYHSVRSHILSYCKSLSCHLKWSQNCSVVSNSLQPHGLYSPWNSLGQNTGAGSHSFLQGIFPTQG